MKFADTSWWVAWSLPSEPRHQEALGALGHLGSNERILTTNHVVGETWTFLRRKAGHASAVGFVDRIDAQESRSELVVHPVSPEQEAEAWKWLRKHDHRTFSFVDATSFVVMRHRRLREVLAFDEDFASAGFIELRDWLSSWSR